MSDLDSTRTPAGIGTEQLAIAARACCMRLTNQDNVPDWQDVPDEWKAKWRNAANVVFQCYVYETKVQFSALAERVAEQIIGTGVWKSRPQVYHWMWEAVTRHLANLISAEDAYEIQEASENDWKQWILDHLEAEKEGAT